MYILGENQSFSGGKTVLLLEIHNKLGENRMLFLEFKISQTYHFIPQF